MGSILLSPEDLGACFRVSETAGVATELGLVLRYTLHASFKLQLHDSTFPFSQRFGRFTCEDGRVFLI